MSVYAVIAGGACVCCTPCPCVLYVLTVCIVHAMRYPDDGTLPSVIPQHGGGEHRWRLSRSLVSAARNSVYGTDIFAGKQVHSEPTIFYHKPFTVACTPLCYITPTSTPPQQPFTIPSLALCFFPHRPQANRESSACADIGLLQRHQRVLLIPYHSVIPGPPRLAASQQTPPTQQSESILPSSSLVIGDFPPFLRSHPGGRSSFPLSFLPFSCRSILVF